jgi:predicted transcriptional regulator
VDGLVRPNPLLKLPEPRSRFAGVSIELSTSAEEQLRNLAAKQGRDVSALVEDAVRQYLEATAITDLEPAEVAETQTALVRELPGVSVWKAGKA